MANTTAQHFAAGNGPYDGAVMGTTAGGNYNETVVCRFQFTTPNTGASSISFRTGSANAIVRGSSGSDDSIGKMRFAIGSNAIEHKTRKSSSVGYPITDFLYGIAGTGYVSGSLGIKLMPSTTYYLWIFPAENFSSKTKFELTDCTVSFSGTYGTASTISCSNVVLGNSTTIKLSNTISGVKNTLRVYFGNTMVQELLDGTSTAMSVTWTPAINTYAPKNTSGKTVTVTLKCTTTYNGVSWNGTSTKDVVLTIPSSCAPTLDLSNSNPRAYNTYSGSVVSSITGIVKGYSKLRFDAAYTLKNGASLSEIKIIYNGETRTYQNNLSSPMTLTTNNVAAKSGTTNVTVRIKDSRGFTTEGKQPFQVLPYSNPGLSNVSLFRSLLDKTPDDAGAFLTAGAKCNFSSLGGENSIQSAKVTCKKKTDNTADINNQNLQDYNGTTKSYQGLDPNYTYIATITVTDRLGNQGKATATIPAAKWAMKFDATATAVAFGKAPEDTSVLEIPSTWDFVRNTGANQERVFGHRKIRTFSSVTDIGLQSGSAEISAAWAAMTAPSILIAPESDWKANQLAGTYGSIEIVKITNNRGYVYWHGAGSGYANYFMNATGSGPTGTWNRIVTDAASMLSDMLLVEAVTSSALSIAANGNGDVSKSAAKTGYTPIGIVGWSLPGSISSYAGVFRCWLDGTTAKASIRNYNGSNTMTSTFVWYVLYLKNTY